jgi:hypothetical protein
MKKFKVFLWLVLLALLALFFYQNKDFFLARPTLSFQFPFFDPYRIPPVPNAVLFVGFFVLGLLIAYFFSLFERFKANRLAKNRESEISGLREELSALRMQENPPTTEPSGEPAVVPETAETTAATEGRNAS